MMASTLGLSNVEIENVLMPYCTNFMGVFSSNNIPKELTRRNNFSIICNLSKVGKEGTHFVTIIGSQNNMKYIDPLGLHCFVPSIQDFLKACARPLVHNARILQSPTSFHCGFYCILFIFTSEKNITNVPAIKFGDNLRTNDRKCIQYILYIMRNNPMK